MSSKYELKIHPDETPEEELKLAIKPQHHLPPMQEDIRKMSKVGEKVQAMVSPSLAERLRSRAAKGEVDFKEEDHAGIAGVVIEQLKANLVYTSQLKESYHGLVKFLLYISLVLLLITWQNKFFVTGVVAYKSMRDALFDLSEGVVVTPKTINDRVMSLEKFLDYVEETIIGTIFTEPVCGDEKCAVPEEYPEFQAALDARKFVGCRADCGDAVTRSVRVDFFDVGKLKQAHRTLEAALESGYLGVSALAWGVVDGEGTALRPPVAGWNICHQRKKEEGFLVPLCIFDGDIFIDSFPYRTAELDPASSSFGASKTVELFEAVRGKICIASENYDDDSSSEEEEEEECNVWAPCPTTSTCECTWYRGTYYCFGANTTDPTSSFHPSSTYYPVHLGLEWAAKYIVANTDDDDFTLVAPNKAHAFATTTGDDDAWLLWDPAGCDDYVLYMADVFGDGWNGAEFSITERNGGLAQIFDFNAGEGEIDDDSGYMTKTQTIFLCPNRVYDITITDGIFPSEIFFEMEDPSGVSIFSGSNPPFSCTLFGEDDDDDDTCSVRRRLLPQQKKKRTRRRHLTACANPSWTGDGWCDAGTNTADCSWDGGDCCEASCVDGAYVCGSNGYNCLEPNPTASPTTLAPTTSMPPSSEPTISSAPTPMPSAVPSVSPSMGYTFNLFNMPAAALLPCTDVDPDGSRGVKCSSLQYDFPAQSCSPQFAGDATCHEVNNHIGCGFDLGDCCPSDCEDTELLDCNDQFDSDWDQCFAPGYLPNGDSSGWPYFIELSDESKFTTVPYTFAASILDVVEAQQTYAWNTTSLKPDVITSSPERPGPEYIPSMACGDCAAYSGSPFMSIPFHVTTTEKNEYEMFAKLQNGTARVRYFAEPNIVIGGGPLLTQLRLENRKCRKPPFNDDGISLDDICLADPDSRSVFVRKRAYTLTDKFGVDATWSASSELYRETNKDLLETLYPDSNDLRGSGLPYGFFADAGSDAWDEIVKEGCEKLYGMNEFYGINPFVEGMQCNRFPVLFDTNWNTTRVKQVLTLLRDGGYFDGNTALASLQLVTFNVETRLFYYIQVYAQKLSTGEYSYGYSIRDINAEPYAEIGDYIRLGFEIAFIFAVLMLITVELGEMKNAIKETGSVISYFLDLSNVVDIANYCLIIVLLVFAIRYNVGCAVVLDKARFRFDHVYRDFYAVGRILQMNGDQGVKLTRFFRSLNALAEIRSTYNNCIAVFLILVCLQLVKNLSFHPMLGMISHTLYFAANDLAFFVVLLAVVNTVYAFLGTLLFGSYVDNFSTFSLALSASLNILSGNYMPLDDTGRDAMQQIYYWSHMLINFFLLLNFMLAIIVDSYQKAKVEVDANPFYDFRRDPIRHLIRDAIGKPVCKAHHIPDDDLLCLLLEATRRLKDQGAVDGLYTPPMGRLGRIRGRMMRDIEDRALKRVQDGFYTDFLTRSTKLTNIDLADSLNFFVFSPSRDRKKVALSQTLIGSALGIALADLPKDISKVICFNLLERWGVNPDQNRDGIVDDDELRALRELYDVESTATNAAKAKDGELLVRAFVGRSRAIQSARGGQPSARGGSLGY